MIVQPSPIGPRSRPRRALRVLAPVVPVVLFAAVVVAGLAGPNPAPEPTRTEPTVASPAVAVQDAPGLPPDPAATPLAGPVFPAQLAGLQVHGVRWTLEARNRGLARGVIAVAGYLALDPQRPGCGAAGLGVVLQFCPRTGVLAETPWPGSSGAEGALPPYHLHPQIPPGVRVPFLAGAAGRLGGATPPVVVLARFSDPRAEPCLPRGRHCGLELVVERIAWIDGADFERMAIVDPAVDTGAVEEDELSRQAAVARSLLAPGGYPLLAVLVGPATLNSIHPEAAAAVGGDRALWYVRGLHERGDPMRIDWLVVDAVAGVVLASGMIPTGPPATALGTDARAVAAPPEG